MGVPLYFDVHVPYAITLGLRLRGVDVLTSQEDGTREVDDDVLLDRATALGRVLFSQDKDLRINRSQSPILTFRATENRYLKIRSQARSRFPAAIPSIPGFASTPYLTALDDFAVCRRR